MVVVEERLLSSATGGETEQNQYSTSTETMSYFVISNCNIGLYCYDLIFRYPSFEFAKFGLRPFIIPGWGIRSAQMANFSILKFWHHESRLIWTTDSVTWPREKRALEHT